MKCRGSMATGQPVKPLPHRSSTTQLMMAVNRRGVDLSFVRGADVGAGGDAGASFAVVGDAGGAPPHWSMKGAR